MKTEKNLRKVVVIDGCRTPFLRAGTDYMNLMTYQLAQVAIKGVLRRTQIDPAVIDRVIMGTVVSNIKTSNVAREAALTAGIPYHVPAHTVTQACISSFQAITSGVEQICCGQADIVIAGGVDSASDTPIQFKKRMQKKLFNARNLKGFGDILKFITSLRFSDFMPEVPAVAEYISGRTMGQDCDILAARYGATREEQDAFSVRSHHLAAKAAEAGLLSDEIEPVELLDKGKVVKTDNGIRANSSVEKLRTLKPAFTKEYGTLTAGNSTFLTDGAAAVLIMSEEKALELGLNPKAYIWDYTYTAQDLMEELLLGPAYATPKVLDRTGLSLKDMDVFEYHEAFAGQLVANLKCLASDEFAQKKLGRKEKVGDIPMDKLNSWGGSLALGHPFGATGARLVTTTANRLVKGKGTYGITAACAAGALGHAMIMKRYGA